MFLPLSFPENRFVPKVGDVFYVVPESDSVVAEHLEVTEVSGGSFAIGPYRLSVTGSIGHVGKGQQANAYDSEAAFQALQIIPKSGWIQHERRKDVFYRKYVNSKITPPIKRVAFIQLDYAYGRFILCGHYLGEGVNMLADLSAGFAIESHDTASPFKIRDFLGKADVIILGSYAMNVTRESALNSARQARNGNFDRGAE